MFMKESKAILVISFGTSHEETRRKTIEAVEEDLREAFADYEFRRAFTSPTIIRIMEKRDGIHVDHVKEALERLRQDGYRQVVVQPTHLIRGFEYDKMAEIIGDCKDWFDELVFGQILFDQDEDYYQAAQVLAQEFAPYRKPGTGIVLVGHGTDHVANETYRKFEQILKRSGMDDFFVKTVEGKEEDCSLSNGEEIRHLVLAPLLLAAGEHAVKDMAGDEEGSWKSRFEQAGYTVECVMRGLGEYKGIRQIYAEHAKAAASGMHRI